MGKSPGHQQWPDHKLEEKHLNTHAQVSVNGETLAASIDVIEVDEDKHPARYYFPRDAVNMTKLERASTTSTCPFKGSAAYYHLKLDGQSFEDAVWTYEEPYDEHRDLKDRLAFDNEKYPEIEIVLRQQAAET
jgi:uncharacterized protein (DUF427 family)